MRQHFDTVAKSPRQNLCFYAPIVQKVVVLLWTFWTGTQNQLKSVGFFHRRKND